jgi:hypothetical protein
MRLRSSRLRWLALAVLYHAVEQTGPDPGEPGLDVRLALAVLHAMSDGDREPFDSFWTMLRDPLRYSDREGDRATIRRTYAQTHLTGIARRVGLEMTWQLMDSLGKGRKAKRDVRSEI